MTSPVKIALTIIIPSLLAGGLWMLMRWSALRGPTVAAIEFSRVVSSNDSSRLGDLTKLPAFLAVKTPTEQSKLLLELLASEISPEGTAKLIANGQFGSLKQIFPEEATDWAAASSVSPDDCVAFRMERQGIRAELVLLKSSETYLILRCNNVRQMAGDISQP
jgi:hypothetical protein